MTGQPNKNQLAFEAMAREVRKFGLHPITPFDLNVIEPQKFDDWVGNMKRDIKFLMDFDAVVVLPGWEISRGAKIEIALAQAMEIPVYYLATKPKKDLKPLRVAVDIEITPLIPSDLLN